jgi:Zn-dependent M28 family amino/carboxypeptidase
MKAWWLLASLLLALPASAAPVRIAAPRARVARRVRRDVGRVEGPRRIREDLRFLTEVGGGRDPMDERAYRATATWVGQRLARGGVRPAGTEGFLHPFAWEARRFAGVTKPKAPLRSWNVVGVHEGDGSTDEAILVMGHLDGLTERQKDWYRRRGQVMDGYTGANDNATAVASVLHIADTLGALRARGQRQKRHIVYFIPSAEEEGLKGAEAFARFATQFPDYRFVAAVNFEMVGRGDRDRIRLFGGRSAEEAEANPVYQRAMKLRPPGRTATLIPGHDHDGGHEWFTRSDHYVFDRIGIPSILYLGDQGPYHRPEDDLASLDIATNEAVARHAVHTVLDLANGPATGKGVTLPRRDVSTWSDEPVFDGH